MRTMFLFPFATPETVKLVGVKKSVWIVRAISIFMLLWIIVRLL